VFPMRDGIISLDGKKSQLEANELLMYLQLNPTRHFELIRVVHSPRRSISVRMETSDDITMPSWEHLSGTTRRPSETGCQATVVYIKRVSQAGRPVALHLRGTRTTLAPHVDIFYFPHRPQGLTHPCAHSIA
jgi:hypothetical protein